VSRRAGPILMLLEAIKAVALGVVLLVAVILVSCEMMP
jgi:hypothetical protein